MPIQTQEVQKHSSAKKLVVLLHGYTLSPDSLRHVKAQISAAYGGNEASFFVPRLPAAVFSFADPVALCNQLLKQIDELWDAHQQQGTPYQSIIIVGHSFGALLGRKLYIYACGETDQAPFEQDISFKNTRPWAAKVERIILLAGMNRGWSISHHMSLTKAASFALGAGLGGMLQMLRKRKPLIFNIRRGSPFITNLRIQWLAMRQAAKSQGVGNALTVQLLGSVDDVVSPDDNIDLVSGSDFVYLDVEKSGHANIIEMDDSPYAQDRKIQFRKALLDDEQTLKKASVLPQDTVLPSKRDNVTDVIFVIHGIRDLGYWTHKIARRVKKIGKGKQRVFETETSSYGYFPMLSFLFPWRRRAKVEWLMDQYAEGLAQFPNARFSYIGHSHGTYLLAKALKEYPCCRFKHVVLAGSVVRTDYQWADFFKQGRVEKILNYVASADWVVAWFPNAMQMLDWQDLGGAGHRGFESKQVQQIEYVKGAHSAALHEDNWDAIANFVIDGIPVPPPNPIQQAKQSLWVSAIGKVAPLLWLGILVLLTWVGMILWPALTLQEWRGEVGLLLYVSGIYLVLTQI